MNNTLNLTHIKQYGYNWEMFNYKIHEFDLKQIKLTY